MNYLQMHIATSGPRQHGILLLLSCCLLTFALLFQGKDQAKGKAEGVLNAHWESKGKAR